MLEAAGASPPVPAGNESRQKTKPRTLTVPVAPEVVVYDPPPTSDVSCAASVMKKLIPPGEPTCRHWPASRVAASWLAWQCGSVGLHPDDDSPHPISNAAPTITRQKRMHSLGRRATGDGRRATGDGRRATGDGRLATMAT